MIRHAFSRFDSFSDLFCDYTGPFDPVSEYFAWDYRSEHDLKQAARQVASSQEDRGDLTAILRRQASRFGIAEESESLIARLDDAESVAVVTGQQLGLFGGPLYTLYKTLTAIRLAERLQAISGRPAVPVFWLEGEDHDFAEIDHTALLKRDDPVRVRYEPSGKPDNRTAVGRHDLDETITAALDHVGQILPDSDFAPELLSGLREAYRPGRGMIESFVAIMRSLIGPGRVVFISPDDPEVKQLGKALFAREIRDYGESASRLAEVSSRLEENYHAQVSTTHLNMFVHADERRAVERANGGYRLHGTDRTYSQQELLDLLDEEPQSFSPNVVLRPLLQDTLLPTAAYVAGPGEVAYFAQFKPLYEWADVQMPVIYPRASITLLERRIGKILNEHGLAVFDFDDQVERLFRRVVLDELDTDLEEFFKQAGAHLHRAVNEVKPVIEETDRSLVKTAEATRASFMKDWNHLKDRVIKAEKDNHDIVRSQLQRGSNSLYPFGTLQERVLSPLFFMSKYGADLPARLLEELDLDTREHQVIEL